MAPPSSTVSSPRNPQATHSGLRSLPILATVPAGQLPLHPRITPGWAVSGVIMMGAGVAYALVGIKSRWLHCFVSAAALGSLATAVLIIYVMTLPVSNAIQGAFVAAAVCTGLVLGGAAIIFRDATECLACLLGGFCFSMWVLALRNGGLLPQTGARAAFILAFTFGGFALYFSRWTRPAALIGCISISGATILVLGIDCFSRAGLKEFWAYLWALNSDLFPLGADTYPVTKGMRVELAATVLFAIIGIVSQVRLWRVVRERRAKRDADRAENDRTTQDEEQNAGRRVEEENRRDRKEWERVYGNGTGPASIGASADSGVGDMDYEKRLHNGDITASTTDGARSPGDQHIEMAAMPPDENGVLSPPKRITTHAGISQSTKEGVVVVRVAQDDVPPAGLDGEGVDGPPERKSWMLGSTSTPTPDVVALPFGVVAPEHDVEERSSVATFADEDGEVPSSVIGNKRNSMVNRLSAGSSRLLRSFSQRSKGMDLETGGIPGESREELVMSRSSQHNDNDSLAANLDDLSVEDSDVDTVRDGGAGEPGQDIETNDDLTQEHEQQDVNLEGDKNLSQVSIPQLPQITSVEFPNTETAVAGLLHDSEGHASEDPTTKSPGSEDEGTKTDATAAHAETRESPPLENDSPKESDYKSGRPGSLASAGSTPTDLVRGNLPRALSRVAMSYRTNEWAKHLSAAETPEPEDWRVNEDPEESSVPMVDEEPAPLNIEELQQTAETATPPPAAPRSVSMMSTYSQGQTLPQNNSRSSVCLPGALLEPYRIGSGNFYRHGSQIFTETIAEEDDSEAHPTSMPAESTDLETAKPSGDSSPTTPDPSASTSSFTSPPPAQGVVSYSSPQTLIGKRESFLRSKSQVSFYMPSPTMEPVMTPAITSRRASDAGSFYAYPTYPPTSYAPSVDPADADDLPLSHRRDLMRRSSLGPGIFASGQAAAADDAVPFNSHQPRRSDYSLSDAARQARLASFRDSVSAELHAGPVMMAGSTPNLHERDGDVRRTVDAQRDHLLGIRDAEAQRREARRVEKERDDRRFEQRMRNGDLMVAHREAMRRMQSEVKS